MVGTRTSSRRICVSGSAMGKDVGSQARRPRRRCTNSTFTSRTYMLTVDSVSYASNLSPRRTPAGASPTSPLTIPALPNYLPRVLKYVKGAIGETDVPDAVTEFISQRRRWLNGSFFAGTYAIAHVGQILRSGHSLQRRIMLLVETVYNIINLIFSWFSIVSDFCCGGGGVGV